LEVKNVIMHMSFRELTMPYVTNNIGVEEAIPYAMNNQNFREIPLERVVIPSMKRTKIKLVLLHVVRPKPDHTTIRYTFRDQKGKRAKNESTFHRFLIFGEPNSTGVVCSLFTDSIKSSNIIMQYYPLLSPGSVVLILCPKLHGWLGETANLIITTENPLIPMVQQQIVDNILPRYATNEEEYSWFSFVTNSLEIGHANIVQDVCGGKVCDSAEDRGTGCGCISSCLGKAHAMRFRLMCDEFISERMGELTVVDCQSNR